MSILGNLCLHWSADACLTVFASGGFFIQNPQFSLRLTASTMKSPMQLTRAFFRACPSLACCFRVRFFTPYTFDRSMRWQSSCPLSVCFLKPASWPPVQWKERCQAFADLKAKTSAGCSVAKQSWMSIVWAMLRMLHTWCVEVELDTAIRAVCLRSAERLLSRVPDRGAWSARLVARVCQRAWQICLKCVTCALF